MNTFKILGFWAAVMLWGSLLFAGDFNFQMTTSNGSTETAFQNVSGSTVAVITSAGYVGIGAPVPATLLQVSSGTVTIDGSNSALNFLMGCGQRS